MLKAQEAHTMTEGQILGVGIFYRKAWKVLSIKYPFTKYPVYAISNLWNVLSMKCSIYEMFYLWNFQSMKCPVYEMSCLWNILSMICPVDEMSCLWNILSMICPVDKMSFLWNFLSMKCLSMKCPNTRDFITFLLSYFKDKRRPLSRL